MKLYRASGDPINKTAYVEKVNQAMDELELEMGKPNPENVVEFQKELAKKHKEFEGEFPNVRKVKYPRTAKEMKDLCKKYGSVAFCLEGNYLVAYILDK